MPAKHRHPDRPGCFGSILQLFGIQNRAEYQVEHLPADVDVLPYRLRDDFLSPAEKSFYHILAAWAGDRYAICTKVSLADLFFVVRPNENKSAYNRINRKHVDFVICEAGTVKPLFAVELDDSSHRREDRAARDAFVDDVFEAAGLPLLHVPVRASYNTEDVAVLLNKTLNLPQSAGSAAIEEPQREPVTAAAANEAPFCPKCGDRMMLRTAKTGGQAGRQFYGCPNYPRCRVILPVEG